MNQRLIWIDLEMTGLDSSRDSILEIAVIVTDNQLNTLAESPAIAIWHSDETLAAMDEWNQQHHRQSGLIERVRQSQYSIESAERTILDFLTPITQAGSSPMCGNSICQDRRFMARLMPTLEAHFHYRNLDVSTLKELCKRWYPKHTFNKTSQHTALSDIRDSIAELRYYREAVFVEAPGPDSAGAKEIASRHGVTVSAEHD